ncbi:MAG: excinuclease ABC subunit C [Bacteroidetes bacterium]|nr:excinuclease ABC subunit C [Bacteroidota bacterium]
MKPSLAEKLENIPTTPGVYQYKDHTGKIIYVGKAKNLRNRVRSYFQSGRPRDAKTVSLINHIEDVDFVQTDTEMEALILENNLVKELKPRYNINLKDDKTFPFIVVTNEPFPRVFTTRRIVKDGSRYFGPYTNAGMMKQALRMIKDLFMVRSCNLALTDDTIAASKWKVCLDYHIKKCLGPCVGFQTRADYQEMIDQVVQLINGKTRVLRTIIQEAMNQRAEALDFEGAALLRDRLRALDVYEARQKIVNDDLGDRDVVGLDVLGTDAAVVLLQIRDGKMVGSQHFYLDGLDEELLADQFEAFLFRHYKTVAFIPQEVVVAPLPDTDYSGLAAALRTLSDRKVSVVIPRIGEKLKLLDMARKNAGHLLSDLMLQKQKKIEEFVPGSVRALQRDLRLPGLPRRIECFDNSNIQGLDPVSSMVCFVDGKPKKSDYRKFSVKTVVGADDFATMAEIMSRRYNGSLSTELPLPDLIVIDGGKGQLSHAVAVLKQTTAASVMVIGLAKKLEEVYLPGDKDPYSLPKTSSGLRLLQQVRDEAHRFAITYHREKRSKRTLTSELLTIPGIGKTLTASLLTTFGSVKGVREASDEALVGLVGKKKAEIIRNHLKHQEKPDDQSGSEQVG